MFYNDRSVKGRLYVDIYHIIFSCVNGLYRIRIYPKFCHIARTLEESFYYLYIYDAVIAGGKSGNFLQKVNVTLVSTKECSDYLANRDKLPRGIQGDTMLCAICQVRLSILI